jgi:IclR family transcriptional regulator, acetate operon repressor
MSNGFADRATVPPRYFQSVDRALTVLEILAERGWSGVTEVARELGIHKSTASRLLGALERRGMVEQHAETAKYRLGQGVAHLARAVTAELDLRRHARPACERLAEVVQETVNVAVLDGDEVIHIDEVIRSASALNVSWLGRRAPVHCTSSGKVFLAHLPESVRQSILGRSLERFTPHTIVDPAEYEKQLRAVRASGFGYTIEELEAGLNAAAAPIRSADGRVIAAVSVAGPSHRMPVERIPEIGTMTKAAAGEVSWRLGFREGR